MAYYIIISGTPTGMKVCSMQFWSVFLQSKIYTFEWASPVLWINKRAAFWSKAARDISQCFCEMSGNLSCSVKFLILKSKDQKHDDDSLTPRNPMENPTQIFFLSFFLFFFFFKEEVTSRHAWWLMHESKETFFNLRMISQLNPPILVALITSTKFPPNFLCSRLRNKNCHKMQIKVERLL